MNRPLGRPLAAAAATLGMTPTQVTLASGVSTFSGIACIAILPQTLAASIAIAALLMLGYALDSADGQVARLTGQSSLGGEWLDHCLDAAKAATIHLAVLVSWVRFLDLPTGLLAVPLVFSAVASTFFFGVIAVDLLRRIHRLQHPASVPAAAGRTSMLYSLLVAPADYGLLCVLFLALWVPWLFIPLYTTLAVVNLLLLFASIARWHRSLVMLERS